MRCQFLVVMLVAVLTSSALAQVENPDFRIRAKFRNASDESVGSATFRVKSRFLQVYYGGVQRQDEYRFQVNLESPAFADQSFDVFLDDFFVGTHVADLAGVVDVTYRSDFKLGDEPDLPLPIDFPDLVNVGDVVNIFDTLTGDLFLTSTLGEAFSRGDTDEDGDVDSDDLAVLLSTLGGTGIGPTSGDFDGDNDSDGGDFLTFQRNFTGDGSGGGNPLAVPEPSSLFLMGLFVAGNVVLFRRRQ